MEFKTKAEAFNHYRTVGLEKIESRAAEIKRIVETDPNADVAALNIEIGGLQEAKANIQEKQQEQRSNFNPIIGANMTFNNTASTEATTGDVVASAEYRSAFYKSLLGQELNEQEQAAYKKAAEEKRADAFNTSTNSAAVIPLQTLNEVVNKARMQGGIMSICRGFNIPANVSVPVGTPSGAAAWHTEGASVDREKADIVNVAFGGYEILKVFSISTKVKRMSVTAFENYLADELNACTMATIANSLVNGTGANQGTGVLSGVTWGATNSKTYTAAAGIKYTDITALIALLARGYANGAVFTMNHVSLYNNIYGIIDDNKRPIFTPDPRNELIGRLLGFPVVVDDYIPDGNVLFGNFYYMGYNLPEGIAIEKSTESGFTHGLIDYRAMAIADTKPIVPEAFVKLHEASA
jgi:HK97 family phage major capsid protein